MKKAFLNILLTLNFIAVLALLIAYLSVSIPPDKIWIPSLFGIAYPFIFVANLFFILFWLLLKPRYLIISLISIAAGWGFVSHFIQLEGKEIEKGDVKVLSYNVKHFVGDGAKNQSENAIEIVDFLEEQNADIICLQEVRLRKNEIFNLPATIEKLSSINHYQYARTSTTFGSVTMTRYPIINMGEIRFDNSRNMTIFTDIIIQEDTIRIFNVHLQSYQIDPGSYSVLESPGVIEEEDLREIREMGGKFKKAFELRAGQVREIRKYIDESPYPVLVCGDFNDTPTSFSYKNLQKGLKDAFVVSGKGIGRTYIGKSPSFRIDYIFYDIGFESFNFKTYDFQKSDHLPISCELVKE